MPRKDGNKALFLLCCLLTEGKSFSQSSAVNSSWRLNDKQWARGLERTEQGSVEHTESVWTVFSVSVCVSDVLFSLGLENDFHESCGMWVYYKTRADGRKFAGSLSWCPHIKLFSLLDTQEVHRDGKGRCGGHSEIQMGPPLLHTLLWPFEPPHFSLSEVPLGLSERHWPSRCWQAP